MEFWRIATQCLFKIPTNKHTASLVALEIAMEGKKRQAPIDSFFHEPGKNQRV